MSYHVLQPGSLSNPSTQYRVVDFDEWRHCTDETPFLSEHPTWAAAWAAAERLNKWAGERQTFGDPDAYAAVKVRFNLNHTQRNMLDTSPFYVGILNAALAEDWKRVEMLLRFAKILVAPQAKHIPGEGGRTACGLPLERGQVTS